LDASERKAYNELRDDLITLIGLGHVTAANGLVKLLRLQQVNGGWLTPQGDEERSIPTQIGKSRQRCLTEILEDLGPKEPVVVFCRFWTDLDVVNLASQEICERPAMELSGRKNQLDEWQKSDAPPILAVQIQAGGLGVDLTRACYAVYYSIGFSLGDYEQAKARTHRPGQTRPVTHVHVVAEDTVDEKIYAALTAKRDVVKFVLENMKFGTQELAKGRPTSTGE
jgi:SNF2 family DNA or RNA helicase